MKNKNIIVIIILSCLVGFLGGYIIYDKLINNPNKINNEHLTKDENDMEKGNINFTLEKAKELMNAYKKTDLCGEGYIEDLSDSTKREFAMRNIDVSGKVLCSELINTSTYKQSNYTCTDNNSKIEYYSYDDVLKSAKKLFGNSYTVDKSNDNIKSDWQYYYVEEYDSFIKMELGWGGICAEYFSNTLDVYDFEIINNQLHIYTQRVLVKDLDNLDSMSDDALITNIIKNKYIFEEQDERYYLSSIEEIK